MKKKIKDKLIETSGSVPLVILPLMIILTTIGITYSFDLSTLEKGL